MHHLLQLADDLGINIIEHHGAHLGGYRPGENTIRLSPRLPRRTARSVLAHELAHHVLGHRPTDFGPVRARQERAANEWAAKHLIDPGRYAEVEQLRDGHLASMAHDLDVAPELVAAYRAILERIGDTVYVDGKMGAGQYAHRSEII